MPRVVEKATREPERLAIHAGDGIGCDTDRNQILGEVRNWAAGVATVWIRKFMAKHNIIRDAADIEVIFLRNLRKQSRL